jgi:formamidopyrimidine-DNA glycosylase
MPELPEVETIKLQLQKRVVGQKVESIKVNLRKTLKEGEDKLIGATITGIRRFGKVTVLDFDNHYSAMIHLKMTGQLLYAETPADTAHFSDKVIGGVPGIHTHVIFHLSRGKLYFNDYRRFGWIKIVDRKQETDNREIQKLGPEWLKDITLKYFSEVLSKTKKPIKVLLLDQEKMAGAGNIYVVEALFLAGIRPTRPANSLSKREVEKLFKSMNLILKKAIKLQGSSEQAYVTLEGAEGSYHKHFLVYAREDELCRNGCGVKITKIKLGGRGTYFCPQCQK